jgi:hypothetical protein
MTGLVISGAGLALTSTSDIKVVGVTFTGSTLNYVNGLVIGGAVLNLSAATIASTAATSTLIGNFSVANGTGTYTFSLTSNPGGLFAVSSTGVLSNAISPLTPGSDPITAKADNGAGSVISSPFLITVIASAGFTPKLDFSNATDSMYVGTVVHF